MYVCMYVYPRPAERPGAGRPAGISTGQVSAGRSSPLLLFIHLASLSLSSLVVKPPACTSTLGRLSSIRWEDPQQHTSVLPWRAAAACPASMPPHTPSAPPSPPLSGSAVCNLVPVLSFTLSCGSPSLTLLIVYSGPAGPPGGVLYPSRGSIRVYSLSESRLYPSLSIALYLRV